MSKFSSHESVPVREDTGGPIGEKAKALRAKRVSGLETSFKPCPEMQSRHRRIHLRGADWAILIGLILFTVVARWSDVDLKTSGFFYDSLENWKAGDEVIWQFFYQFGPYPAALTAFAALLVFLAGFKVESLSKWRWISLFLVLALIIGPGLVVNATFKEHFGRPRPRDVFPFGGAFPFEYLWSYDPQSPGKSFACGHCSMGFYFFALWMVFRRVKWKVAAALAFGGTLAWGGLIGVARIAQGGHFLSDVIWAGGFCYLSFVSLWGAMGLEKRPWHVEHQSEKKRASKVWVLSSCGIGLILLVGVGMGTPINRNEEQSFEVVRTVEQGLSQQAPRYEFVGFLHSHRLEIEYGSHPSWRSQTHGFGLPGSAIKSRIQTRFEEDRVRWRIRERVSGYFSERNTHATLVLPSTIPGEVEVEVKPGATLIWDLRQSGRVSELKLKRFREEGESDSDFEMSWSKEGCTIIIHQKPTSKVYWRVISDRSDAPWQETGKEELHSKIPAQASRLEVESGVQIHWKN